MPACWTSKLRARVRKAADEPLIRAVARRFLECAGHRVVEAGQRARRTLDRFHASRESWDPIVTDVVVAGITRFALAQPPCACAPVSRVLCSPGAAVEPDGPGAVQTRGVPFPARPSDSQGRFGALAVAHEARPATER